MIFSMALPAAFVIFAFLIALSFLTPSWHWVAAVILIGGVGLASLWIAHDHAAAQPGYPDGGGGLGIAVFGAWSVSYVIASIAWAAASLWWHERVDGRNH